MTRAQDLVYPLRFEADALHRYLRTLRAPDPRGALAVEVIRTLERCERITRTLYTSDLSGL